MIPDLEDDDEEWEVEEIQDKALLDSETHYLIK